VIPSIRSQLGIEFRPSPIGSISYGNTEQIGIVLDLLKGNALPWRFLMAGENVGPRFLGFSGIHQQFPVKILQWLKLGNMTSFSLKSRWQV